ncbi:hypothetical protein PC129_g17934 [Phytophthora cactorum]|uniref:Uncharacterized protein n=1 Tax=Phytophthora cactorum TaxID=29920 RepID=A0A329RPJ6_9STRA|nr:hypothetical protein Pcac1_g17789 [Phytophthora cactorum]KAG2893974.1 hypothetical protein PC114_g16064 [Phytophthora cactorum]KAG2905261.1 hypothetical protein PC117_g20787 [Phytophthora cactorum]KAG2979542.1 hypothetical protein PC119_g21458 [Phytophthora cactorum]KAG3136754.1 hypothetical protein C6341_g21267 [Phytophthora cactorum]
MDLSQDESLELYLVLWAMDMEGVWLELIQCA